MNEHLNAHTNESAADDGRPVDARMKPRFAPFGGLTGQEAGIRSGEARRARRELERAEEMNGSNDGVIRRLRAIVVHEKVTTYVLRAARELTRLLEQEERRTARDAENAVHPEGGSERAITEWDIEHMTREEREAYRRQLLGLPADEAEMTG